MASSIQILRSTIARERPLPGSLLEGQPAVNLNPNEPGLFFKASDGGLFKVGPAALTFDGLPPNSAPAGQPGNCVGELWYDGSTNPGTLKVFNGSNWLSSGSPNAVTDVLAGTNVSVSRAGNDVTVSVPDAVTDIVPGANVSVSRTGGTVTISSTGGGGGTSTLLRWSVTATAGQTTLSGNDGSGNPLLYTPGLEEVFVNGVLLSRGSDYVATTGNTITGLAPLTAGDVVIVLSFISSGGIVPGPIDSSNVSYQNGLSTYARSVKGRLEDLVTVKDFGVLGDNVADDRFALNTMQASAAQYLLFPAGTYFLGGDYTFNKPVIMMPGAVLRSVSNITFTKTLYADAQRIFDVAGEVTITNNNGQQSEGYPEWWGAVVNNGGPIRTTTTAAINACIKACAITTFRSGDYYTSGPIRVTTSYRTIRGPNRGSIPGGGQGATRIIVSGGSANTMEIETEGLPPSSGVWIREITVENLCLHRDAAPVAPAPGSETIGPKGVSVRNTFWVYLRNVVTVEHYIGVYIHNTIRTRLWEVVSFRSIPGNTSVGPDRFYGFYQLGGNASTYYQECTGLQGGDPMPRADMFGFYLADHINDTFMLRCETTAVGTGVMIDGTGTTNAKAGFVDVFLTEFVIDQFALAGIQIQNVPAWTSIAINGGYCAPASPALGGPVTAGLHFENCQGLISCVNFQTIAWPNPQCRGLYIKNSNGIRTSGNMYVESARPIELDSSSRCSIEDSIKNVDEATTQAAVLCNSSSRNFIRPIIYGANISRGVDLPAGNTLNEVNCTSIDSSAMGGINRVLRVNGVVVTAPGTYSTNLASGIIA